MYFPATASSWVWGPPWSGRLPTSCSVRYAAYTTKGFIKQCRCSFFSFRALVLSKLLLIIIVSFCPIPSTSSGAARPPRCGPLPAPAWGWPYSPTHSARHSGTSKTKEGGGDTLPLSSLRELSCGMFSHSNSSPDYRAVLTRHTSERGGAICILTSYFTSNGGGKVRRPGERRDFSSSNLHAFVPNSENPQ